MYCHGVFRLLLATFLMRIIAGKNMTINIARGKPTGQSSSLTWVGKVLDGSKIVDGKKNIHLAAGACSHTLYTRNPWVYVDLLKEETITSFEITNRGDCCGNRLNGFQAFIGNNKDKGGLGNTLCFQGKTFRGGETVKFNCTKPIKGRYFFIRLPKNGYLTVCELEIYREENVTPTTKSTVAVPYKTHSYSDNNGKCTFIAYHKDWSTWCTNSISQVFVMKDGAWHLVTGSLHRVSVGEAGVWGVQYNSAAYYRQGVGITNPQGIEWTGIEGYNRVISSGPKGVVFIVSRANWLYFREGITCSNPSGNSFKRFGNITNAHWVSCNVHGCWLLKINGDLFFRVGITASNLLGKTWIKVNYDKSDGIFKSIETSVDGKKTIAVSADKKLYIWVGSFIDMHPKGDRWVKISNDKYQHAVPTETGYIAVSADTGLVKHLMKVPTNISFSQTLDNIDAGAKDDACGISQGAIYQLQGMNWVKMQGSLTQVSCANHQIWGVNRHGQIYYRVGADCDNSYGTGWERVKGILKQIDVGGFGLVYAVNSNDRIFKRMGITKSNPMGEKWISIPGHLTRISCGVFACWGINHWKSVKMMRLYPEYKKHRFVDVPGLKLQMVEAGDGLVFGINDKNILFVRLGVSKMNPMGCSWAPIRESVKSVAPQNGRYLTIGLDNKVSVFEFPLH